MQDIHQFINENQNSDLITIDYANEANVVVNLCRFGGSECVNIFDWLHEQCDRAGVSPSKVKFHLGSLNAETVYNNWCIANNITERLHAVVSDPAWLRITWEFARDYSEQNSAILSKRKKIFSLLMGGPRRHRATALQYFFENNVLDHCEYTWLSNDRMSNILDTDIEIPKSLEGTSVQTQFDVSTTSHNPDSFFRVMDDTYFDVVTETFYTYAHIFGLDKFDIESPEWLPEDQVFITEKTWRCIQNKRPFILIGNRYSLKYLHELGFKTFPHLFDETYDELPNETRIYNVLEQVRSLCYSTDIHKIYTDPKTVEILNHNRDRMRELSNVLP